MRGSLKIAWASVRATRWQSMLTILGVVIGVVSLVLVIGIGEGVKYQISRQIDQFGTDLLTVRPGRERQTTDLGLKSDMLFGTDSSGSLSEKDAAALAHVSHVRLVVPLSLVPGSVKGSSATIKNSLVFATNQGLPDALHQTLAFGDFFKDNDNNADTAVIGTNIAMTLFGEQAPLGHSFTFRGHDFIVRGVFDAFAGAPLSPATDFNNAIFIPQGVASTLVDGRLQPQTILIKPDSTKNVAIAKRAVTQRLLKRHGGEQDFMVLDHTEDLQSSSTLMNLLSMMIIAIAAVSLVVGGVGIMNIMLASVTERTHEIGVRKAIGASNRQILNQFMLESIVLSLFGGVVGVVLSCITILLLRIYSDIQPIITWQAVVLATGTSLVVGTIFGTIPAIRAARKDPIDALRNE